MKYGYIITALLLSFSNTLYPQHPRQVDRHVVAQKPRVAQLPADPFGQLLHIEQIHFSPDGKHIAAVAFQRVLIIKTRSLETKNVIQEPETFSLEISAPRSYQDVAWHPDSIHLTLLVNYGDYGSGATPSFIFLWNHKAKKIVEGTTELFFAPTNITWAPRNSQLAVVGEDLARHTGIALVLNYSMPDTQPKFTTHSGSVTDCCWSPDGQTLLTTAEYPRDCLIILEDDLDADGNPIHKSRVEITPLHEHPRAQDSRLKLWEPCRYARCPDLKDLAVFEEDRTPIRDILSAAWSACGNYIATIDASRTLEVWNSHTHQHLARMPAGGYWNYASKLTWLGRRLIAIANSRTVRLLDPFASTPGKQMVRRLDIDDELATHPDTPESPIHSYDITEDGTFVAGTTEGQLIEDQRLAKAVLHHHTGMNITAALAARARTGRMPSALTGRRFVAPKPLVDKRRKR